jgi:hypothetical protein
MKREEKKWHEAIEALEVWASDKGYFINFFNEDDEDRDNCICIINKLIDIDGTLPIETQVYYLLHECGHVLISENGNYFDRIDVKKGQKNKEYRVLTVIEEAEAWKRGYALAKRLCIPIEDERWKFEIIDALNKYILWAAGQSWEKDDY